MGTPFEKASEEQGILIDWYSEAINGRLVFESRQQLQRPALLLTQGQVLVTFGSHVDQYPYLGMIIGECARHSMTAGLH